MRFPLLLAAALAVSVAAGAGRTATTPGRACEAAKVRAAARKVTCLVAQRRTELRGATPDIASCARRFHDRYAALDSAAGAHLDWCPTVDDAGDIGNRLGRLFAGVARRLSGGGRFRNDGYSTTDVDTGLTWENKCDGPDFDPHYRDRLFFPWDLPGFLGSWRLPAVNELLGLVDFDVLGPPAVAEGFFSCTPGCEFSTCNCPSSFPFWTSTPLVPFPFVWLVSLNSGEMLSSFRLAGAVAVHGQDDPATPAFGTGIAPPGSPASVCQRAKLGAVVREVRCRARARTQELMGRRPRPARCQGMLPVSFAAAEAAAALAGGACPSVGDGTDIERRIQVGLDGVVQLLSGAGRFRDNGDGTLTDADTGLTWEKKGDDPADAAHYGEGTYPEAGLPAWLATVQGLGGHDDWRVATIDELLRLVDYTRVERPLPDALDRCEPGCDAIACSCTSTSHVYWSGSPMLPYPPYTWIIHFGTGGTDDSYGVTAAAARAVRGPG